MSETNAERLARLKHVVKIFSEPRISAKDTLFLLGQAERAQELEKEIDNNRWDLAELSVDAMVLKKENARLRDSLKEIKFQATISETSDCVMKAIDKALGESNAHSS